MSQSRKDVYLHLKDIAYINKSLGQSKQIIFPVEDLEALRRVESGDASLRLPQALIFLSLCLAHLALH